MQHIQLLAAEQAQDDSAEQCWPIRRRDFYSGMISVQQSVSPIDFTAATEKWRLNQPILLATLLKDKLVDFQSFIVQSKSLYETVVAGEDIDDVLDSEVYERNLLPTFELLCSRFDAGDEQEIVSVDFDTHIDNELIEDLWMRVSWLSFEESDASLRFRFSFGMEGFEDVSQDLQKQQLAAKLEESVFPESAIVSQSTLLSETLTQIAGIQHFQFLERIVYFNAPNGGAQFHHDAEKGHVGVVYAQLSGKTFWLTLAKQDLIQEIIVFVSHPEQSDVLQSLLGNENSANPDKIANVLQAEFIGQALNDLFHPTLVELLNNNKAFFECLVANGHGYFLEPGDVILLPQASMSHCAWHSVFCVGNEVGEALSFAIKTFD